MKKIIKYIGKNLQGFDKKWGGTLATNYALKKCFENDPDFQFDPLYNINIPLTNYPEKSLAMIKEHLKGADIIHVDDSGILDFMFINGMKAPDVIGVISRSPLKEYHTGKAPKCSKEWFYSAKVIRLNKATERGNEDLIYQLIDHGVDTEYFKPHPEIKKDLIIWAGNADLYGKNVEMFKEISYMAVDLKNRGYKFKILTDYTPVQYRRYLKRSAVALITSRYETFCSAGFEAMSAGVPVVWKDKLQGIGIHEEAGFRVDFTPEKFLEATREILDNESYWSSKAREYVEQRASLDVMNKSYRKVYQEVLNK